MQRIDGQKWYHGSVTAVKASTGSLLQLTVGLNAR